MERGKEAFQTASLSNDGLSRLLGALSQAPKSSLLLGMALTLCPAVLCHWLGTANRQLGLGAKVAIDSTLWCLDTWLIMVPVLGVYDSYPHTLQSMTIIKILRFCYYIFNKIYKVVLSSNKMSLSTSVTIINTLLESPNVKNFSLHVFFVFYFKLIEEKMLSMTTRLTYLFFLKEVSLYYSVRKHF